jgi:hypothetical protein
VQRPILLANPASDTEFVEFMRSCAADVDGPEALQMRLRERYPKAVVRPRLIEGEQFPVWYIYREGRWEKGGRDERSGSR